MNIKEEGTFMFYDIKIAEQTEILYVENETAYVIRGARKYPIEEYLCKKLTAVIRVGESYLSHEDVYIQTQLNSKNETESVIIRGEVDTEYSHVFTQKHLPYGLKTKYLVPILNVNTEEYDNVLCYIDEGEYKISDGHKISLHSINDYFRYRNYFQRDFRGLLEQGIIKIYGENNGNL